MRLGVYEVMSPLGSGGMGEVWRATDTRLKRQVALKVLSNAFIADSERIARFAREAEVLAALNHPNIAQIYGIEEAQGVTALVLELVEGAALADRIAQGPIPLDDAIPVARQIAAAIDAAHEQGVIHRDLKPANIKIRPDGTVKVLDFGLAKLVESDATNNQNARALTDSPTITSPAMMTGVGTLLGTAAYMSPEQVKGRAVDKRADIWAFGCVLYEMLTGRRVFDGDDVTDFVVAVMAKDPDWTQLPAHTPPGILELLQRCLKKDPRDRLRSIGDAFHLAAIGNAAALTITRRRDVPTSTWKLALAGLAGIVIALGAARSLAPSSSPRVIRLQMHAPKGWTLGPVTAAPDGQRLAFIATDGLGTPKLWIRSLDAADAEMVRDSEGAAYPFWSPDGRFIGFFADHKVKKVDVKSGVVQTVCDVPSNDQGGARGGTWNGDGIVLFAVEPYGPESLYQVSAAGGGEPRAVTPLESDAENHHHHWPSFLPDGRHFLYYASSTDRRLDGIYVGSLDGGVARLVMNGEGSAVVTSRYLLFVREGKLFARPWNNRSFTVFGEPTLIAEGIGTDEAANGRSRFSASETLLVYSGGSAETQLRWVNRDGTRGDSISTPGFHIDIRTAPDRRRIAVQREDARGGADLWIVDTARNTSERITFSGYNAGPVWSPDGSELAFFKANSVPWKTYVRAATASGVDRLLYETVNDAIPLDWSRDGKWLLFCEVDRRLRLGRIGVLSVAGSDGRPAARLFTPPGFDSNFARFSADGRWLLYQSNESGRREIYIRRFNADGTVGDAKWQISTHGGVEGRWAADDREIFYMAPDNSLMAAEVSAGESIEVRPPRRLFPIPLAGVVVRYDAVDGRRFAVFERIEDENAPATVVVNW